MENIEENVVTKGAAAADPAPKAGVPVEDLGGPTPENYRPDDDSAKLKDPAATLAQVKDVVNAKAAKAEAVSDELEDGQEVVAEDEVATEEGTEVVAEEETSEEEATEVVAEEEVTEEEVIEEINVEEDLQALIAGEELSEEFQDKARTIFETAIKTKVVEIKEELNESYAKALVEELDTIKTGLTERVDSYLEYVADEWVQENQLAVEAGLKTEMTESFLEGMKSLFEEHYVTIPEEKYDVLNSMVDKLDEMENKLNEQIERNVALNSRLAESTADVIFADVAEGLADTQKEKLATLAENVEFESETDYREKLGTLKESYFPSKTSAPKSTSENLSEEVSTEEVASEEVNPRMQAYLDTLSRAAHK
ncbi:T4-like prohead core scaffold protein [Prochlorococcus phage P-SSM2]|uniref:Gp22 n=1 Tax=Prochlorococcus phage P-SSM2 TaxID=268746 RepID=Q58MM0_BPPRM|nr:head scaffolding protein [Prochlorococcus phage P-SSM2]AAX44512.1 T4-like prohead core scaffold protein [Prochlorococcus phage P-SSM2]ACY76013.1 gp22 [Prochlorococcus phage P-SSM2]